MAGKSTARSTQPPAIRLRDRDMEGWLTTQALDGETLGQCAGRLLREYRLLQIDPEVGRTVRALRRLAARIEAGEIAA